MTVSFLPLLLFFDIYIAILSFLYRNTSFDIIRVAGAEVEGPAATDRR